MKRIKVLQLISSGGYYGAENMLLNLCANQEIAGCQNSLLLFYNVHQPNVEFYERARRSGLCVRMVHCQGKADWRAVRQIEECIREDDIDIVHTHGYKADLYGYVAARRTGKPIVATCHNWVGGTAALGIYNRLDRLVLKRFHGVAAVSDEVARQLRDRNIPVARIRTIANGIDVQRFTQAQPLPGLVHKGKKLIGMVARLDLQKGFADLLKAVRALAERTSEFNVVIAGEGPDRKAIETMIRDYGLQSTVMLAGQQANMPRVYAALDIFVLPSLNEGLPMTLLEAMAASKPVIVTRVGAIPMVINDGESGLLVQPGDSSGLRDAIIQLLDNPALGRRMAQRAHASVGQNYTSEAMTLKYRRMYDDILEPLTATAVLHPAHLEGSKIDARRA